MDVAVYLPPDYPKDGKRPEQYYDNYVEYYFRLNSEEKVNFKGRELLLSKSWRRLNPLYAYFNNDHHEWPFNWNNTEKCGVPIGSWNIEGGKLYLEELWLYYGTSFSGADREKLDPETLLGRKPENGRIFADGVNGIYLLKEDITQENEKGKKYIYTAVRFKNGNVIKTQVLPDKISAQTLPDEFSDEMKKFATELTY